MNPLFRVLLFISFFLLSSCAAGKQPIIPIAYNPTLQQILDEEGLQILAVTKNASQKRRYAFRLARFKKPTMAGLSTGGHTIYISVKLMREYASGNRKNLRLVLAHEIAHDVLGHVANQNAMVDITNAGVMIGKAISYVPGVIGWAGAGLAWTSSLGGKATIHLYARSAELATDRLGIEYWKRLGWDCSYWAYQMQRNTELGIEDFHHPGAVRTKQAAELCLPSHELQRFLASIQDVEQNKLDQRMKEEDENDEANDFN